MPPFVSASAVVVDGDRILSVLDPVLSEPTLPGGHLKWRETVVDALVREVREETGYLIEPRELLGVFSGEEWAGEPGIVRVIYEAAVVGGTLASSGEGEACWRPLRELARADTRDAPIIQRWLEERAVSPEP
jgi:ADP-ribose pyrophosphatase YjhB (NUDIX family)